MPKHTHRTKWDTPSLVTWCFWLWAAVAAIASIIAFAGQQWLMGFSLLGTIIMARIGMELTIVIFSIHDVLEQIRDQAAKPQLERTRAAQAAQRKAALQRQSTNAPGEMRLG